ncbi:MAG: Serine/threonine-protein kinase PknD [Thermoanaerobaculia bacterium]|nr:Serine/threonine-protein kinase PknD [Thermoanaerobaculia bacterium]
MSLARGTRLGPYEILTPLGAGGMGEVFRARDTRLDRDVAVKVLPDGVAGDPKALSRFQAEAKAVAALSHPNILAIFELGEVEGTTFVVTELLEGQTLRSALAQGALPVKRVLDIAISIATGLAAAHEKGIVHRDIKPENVFLTKDGQAKVLDFGLARHETTLRSDEDASTISVLTDVGTVLGTVSYMSPEQARALPVDHRSDQFSLGIVLYEMLSGRRPFRGTSKAETLASIIRDEPEPLEKAAPGLAGPVCWLVERLLSKEASRRYESTHDLVQELMTCRVHLSEGKERPPAPAKVPERIPWKLIWLAAAVSTALVAGFIAVRSGHRPPSSGGSVSLLALPCKVYGAPEFVFLTDAVPGTISTLLSGIEGLDTKVPPSSMDVEKVKGDLSRLADLYQVTLFVVTSVTAAPGRFALNVQLVDARTRKVTWGKQYEGPRETYNDLARQSAEGIRQAVKPSASPIGDTGQSSEAELAFRQGKYLSNRYNNFHKPTDFDAAMEAFTRALAIDPSQAVAAAEAGFLYILRFEGEGDVNHARKQAESWARRALGIDPRCGQGWATLSGVELYAAHPDPERGVDYAVKAVAFSPREAWVHLSMGLWAANPGSTSLFMAAVQRSHELNPLYLYATSNMAFALTLRGRPQEALPVIDQALQLEPGWPYGFATRSYALLQLGRLEEAEKSLKSAEGEYAAASPVHEWCRQIRLAIAASRKDTSAFETQACKTLPQLFDGSADGSTVANAAQCLAPKLARFGWTDDAMKILIRSVEVGVAPPYDWLLTDPDIQLLRTDPRFAVVMAGSREGAAMVATALDQARVRGELPRYLERPLEELHELLKRDSKN